ncbi:MAG: DegT/DnrJ/EryC1/StrS family aminotransferase [Turneriella sp.]|nr:DegT/DnrJ/EryC1/StrS family aminotransferase [Turneriella sp.]
MKRMILTAGPSITDLEINYVTDAIKNGWNENWNSYLARFEKKMADYNEVRHALSTSSCTGAMHLILLALGIGPGDEVIVPELTWVATASAVKYTGATPIFADVDINTWTIDPVSVRKKISARTKAIMPVHLYGHPAEMDQIMTIATEFNLLVVEDAAPAVGAEFKGKKTGTFGNAGAFSFQGAKMLVTGEGGMLITNDSELHAKIVQLGDHGRSRNPETPFWIDQLGYKYKMSNLQAALGLAQLERVDELIAKKRQIFSWYQSRLANIPGLQLNEEASWAKSIYWMSSIFLRKTFKLDRDGLIKALKVDQIDSRPVFPTISKYPMWKTDAINPVATEIGRNAINLPSGHNLQEDQVDYICKSIIRNLGV